MKACFRDFCVALALLALSLFSSTAFGQAAIFPIATNTHLIELSGGIAAGKTNYLAGFLSGTNICAQLVLTNGTTGLLTTNGHSTGFEVPYVASGTDYLEVWYDAIQGNGYGQILSRSGAPAGPPISFSYAPMAVASDGTNFLVALEDSQDNVYGQFVTGAGALSGTTFLINGQQEDGSQGPVAVVFGTAGYFVLHQANYTGTSEQNYAVGAFVSPNGLVTVPFQIAETGSEDHNFAVAAFDGTNYLAVWNWDPPPETEHSETNWQVRGRLVSPAGTFPGPELGLVLSGNPSVPAVAFNGTNYLLCWNSGWIVSNSPTLDYQFLDRSALPVGPPFTIFSAQGTNSPLFSINGLAYDGKRFVAAATLGKVNETNLMFEGLLSGQVFGAFISTNGPAGDEFFADPIAGIVPLSVQFYASGQDNSGSNIVSWKWNFGDGSGSTLQNPLHIYTNAGNYTPTLVATNIEHIAAQGFPASTIYVSPSNQLYGHVLDNYGNPVSGVSVTANDGTGDVYSNETDRTGYYSIFVTGGTWDVIADCGELSNLGYSCAIGQHISLCCGFSNEVDFSTKNLSPPMFPFTTLYGFSSDTNFFSNSDGAHLYSGLALSGDTLYGTAFFGGTYGWGTVFAINTNADFSTLYSFDLFNDGDGAYPQGGLILLSNVLFGTTSSGGMNGAGMVFKLNTNGMGFTGLYSFGSINTNAQGVYTNGDGNNPKGALVASGNTLYGTTSAGGTNGNGTVFSVGTNGLGFRVLHTFSPLNSSGSTNNDGTYPSASLVLSGTTLYGTAPNGGANGAGTVFRIDTNGTGFSVIYTFAWNEGGAPLSGLFIASNTLYGTASVGGFQSYGVAFSMSTNGSGFTVLHNFTGGDDGGFPYAALVLSNNFLYGTTYQGGNDGYGTVFSINTNTLNLTVLHSFTGGDDGANPRAGLVFSDGVLYGTTYDGGIGNDGTVFAISVTATPVTTAPGYSNGQFQMTVSGLADQTFIVQMSTNLLVTNWISLLVTNPPANSFLFTDPNATNVQRFYRVLETQ